MNTMTRLDATLADIGDLLQEADDQAITECLKRGKDIDHDDPCPWCGHLFHGLACPPPPLFISARDGWALGMDDYALNTPEPGQDNWKCPCETSLPR